MASLRRSFAPLAAGWATGAAVAVLDNGLASMPGGRMVAKAVLMVGVAATAGRSRSQGMRNAAAGMVGALAGSMGYRMGTRLAGGVVAHDTAELVEETQKAVTTGNEGMGALLTGGMGALLTGPQDAPNVPTTVYDYETALRNIGAEDDDDA